MIKTERLNIIPLERRHLESLRKLRLDYSTWHYLSDAHPINDLQQEKWFERISSDHTKMYFAIEVPGMIRGVSTSPAFRESDFAGVIRSDEYDKTNRSIRVGVDIDPLFRGNGYGTEALRGYIDYLFQQLNIHRVWLLVAQPNIVAKNLYNKIGFTSEGAYREALFRDGEYFDYEIMSLLSTKWKKETK